MRRPRILPVVSASIRFAIKGSIKVKFEAMKFTFRFGNEFKVVLSHQLRRVNFTRRVPILPFWAVAFAKALRQSHPTPSSPSRSIPTPKSFEYPLLPWMVFSSVMRRRKIASAPPLSSSIRVSLMFWLRILNTDGRFYQVMLEHEGPFF